jgi:uncharacterized protein (TIGR02246 family)
METKQINFIGLDPVSQLVKNWINTLGTFNPEAVVNLYAPDGILLGTIAENIKVGRDEILTYFNMFVRKQPIGMINTMYIQDFGSSKVADGIYTFTLTDSLGKKTEVIARYTFVFTQYMDEWKIASHHSSKQP